MGTLGWWPMTYYLFPPLDLQNWVPAGNCGCVGVEKRLMMIVDKSIAMTPGSDIIRLPIASFLSISILFLFKHTLGRINNSLVKRSTVEVDRFIDIITYSTFCQKRLKNFANFYLTYNKSEKSEKITRPIWNVQKIMQKISFRLDFLYTR
jgi:hypothetical protein